MVTAYHSELLAKFYESGRGYITRDFRVTWQSHDNGVITNHEKHNNKYIKITGTTCYELRSKKEDVMAICHENK